VSLDDAHSEEMNESPPLAISAEPCAEESSRPILRVFAGLLALFFAGVPIILLATGKPIGDLILVPALGLMFGWFAVRGKKGLPRFLAK
jgi:hypothetical protein